MLFWRGLDKLCLFDLAIETAIENTLKCIPDVFFVDMLLDYLVKCLCYAVGH